jgi:hypothetical protein
VLPGSPNCQWNPSCGADGNYCCDSDIPGSPTCRPGLECDYDEDYGYQHPYVCTPKGDTLRDGVCITNCLPVGGGSGGDGDNCDPTAQNCCDPLIDDCN